MSPLRLADLRARLKRDDGYTLIEIAVVVGLLGVVVAMVMSFLTRAQSDLQIQISRSTSNDQVRLAAHSIDREIRSGNVFYDPAAEDYSPGDVAPGMSLRVLSQANSPTRPGERCVQWRITTDGDLQRRSWTVSPSWQSDPAANVSGWRTVAEGIRNRADGVTAFTRTQPNLITINLRANEDPTSKKGSTVQIKLAVSGRGTQFFSTSNPTFPCGSQSADPGASNPNGPPVPPY
jgi:prepilin-type N-terminal cleavage/methylation domain-containing protein